MGDSIPRDAETVRSIFKAMGVEKYEPATIVQLLEFQYRYVKEILEESQAYAAHNKREEINIDDVRLATQSRVNFSFTQPPPREFLIQLAATKNQEPLEELDVRPPLGAEWGRVLPKMGDEWLSGSNFQVTKSRSETKKADKEADTQMTDAVPSGSSWGETARVEAPSANGGGAVRPTPPGPRRGGSLGALTINLPTEAPKRVPTGGENQWDAPE